MSVAKERLFDDSQNPLYLSDGELQPATPAPARSSTWPGVLQPQWQPEVMHRLYNLLKLRANWDSYGAKRPSLASANELLKVLASIMSANAPAPSIVPSASGHFQAEWHQNGVDLEIEVVTPTTILVSYSDPQGEWDKNFDFDFTELVQAV